MLVLLDKAFARLGKGIVLAADFVGISQIQLVYGWIVAATILIFVPYSVPQQRYSLMIPVLCASQLVFVLAMNLFAAWIRLSANRMVSEQGLSPKFVYRPLQPLAVIMGIAISLTFPLVLGTQFQIGIAIVKIALPLSLWNYFLFGPDTRCKRRLRDRAKDMVISARKTLAPKPAPKRAPQPT